MSADTIIGLVGYAQHGKDTAGEVLMKQHGFYSIAFAAKLKQMALVLDPLLPNDNGRLARLVADCGWEAAKENPEVRRFLQVLGTEAVRDHLGENAWVDAAFNQMYELEDNGLASRFVFTDVRFPNEADRVEDEGGYLLGVVRLNPDGTPFDNGVGKDHPSEAHIEALLKRCDHIIEASDVHDLRAQVVEWFQQQEGEVF